MVNVLKNFNPFMQIVVFMLIWFIIQYFSVSLIGNFLNENYNSIDMNELVIQYKGDAEFSRDIIWMNALSQVLNFLLPVLIFAILSSRKPLSFIGFHRLDNQNFKLSIVILLPILMVICLPRIGVLINQLPIGDISDKLQETRKAIESMYFIDTSVMGLIRNLLLMAAVPAVCEELFFRGIFQRMLFSITKKVWISVLFTGIFFAFVHSSIVNFLPILLASIILGFMYHYTKNLWYSIITHFIYNGIQVVMNYVAVKNNVVSSVSENGLTTTQILLYVAVAVISGSVIYLLLKKYREAYKNHHAVVSDSDWALGQNK